MQATSATARNPGTVETDDPGRVTAQKIVSAVEQIVRIANPVRVIAFGSRARGDHRRDSDLDLAVIVPHYDPGTDKRPLRRADIDVWMSMDVLVASEERHEFMRDSIISVHHDIAEQGVTLYDSAVGSIDHRAAQRIAG